MLMTIFFSGCLKRPNPPSFFAFLGGEERAEEEGATFKLLDKDGSGISSSCYWVGLGADARDEK